MMILYNQLVYETTDSVHQCDTIRAFLAKFVRQFARNHELYKDAHFGSLSTTDFHENLDVVFGPLAIDVPEGNTFDEAVEQAMKREFWECDDVNICNFTAWNCGGPIETDLKTEWEFVVNPQPGWSF